MKKGEILDKVYKSNLPSRAKQIMFYLINRANAEGTCFPSVKTIASDCGVSERTIQRNMNILVEEGFIIKEERYRDNGGQSSNLYRLQMESENNNIKPSANGKKFDEKKLKDIEVKEEISNIENIEVVNFEDYEEEKDVIQNETKKEKTYIVDVSMGVPSNKANLVNKYNCHPSIFYEIGKKRKPITIMSALSSLCHGESDNLYPP
ncbi:MULTISPECIES: helix-turn-helix domain-containing protein [Clostridia]|uniref:helix-turn-helix domain-containing protein n=1 Tax=Clostridia TaxID=186801 RepID=UPI00177F0309|nr:helix-turn-helix domain-containing protein [Thermoanaerobacterium thermosaccharolyticum]MBE0228158.1 helix-turn-helix domain-containing protein [Thermoanaerobacterium thermosaccharolyticum]